MKTWTRRFKPEEWCVGLDFRTNNCVESLNNQLKNRFIRHPNIWDFMEYLRTFVERSYVSFVVDHRHGFRAKDLSKLTVPLKHCVADMAEGRMTIAAFLATLANV